MTKSSYSRYVEEIEGLRAELYQVCNGDWEALKSPEICEVSRRLDKLIVKHMYKMNPKSSRVLDSWK